MLARFVRLASLLSLVAAAPLFADAKGIKLGSGEMLECKVRAFHPQGVVVDMNGASMQIDWAMLDMRAYLEDRRAITDMSDHKAVRSFETWCREAGLTDEASAAKKLAEQLEAAAGATVEKPVEAPGATGDVGPGREGGSSSSSSGKPGVASCVVAVKTGKGQTADDGLISKLGDRLSEEKYTVSATKPQYTVEFRAVDFVLVKNPRFFGSSLFYEYKATVEIVLLDADGKEVARESLKSANHRSSTGEKTEQGMQKTAKDKVRDDLVGSASTFLGKHLPPVKKS